MICPKCGAEMHRVGFEGIVGSQVLEEWECPVCGFHTQRKREKPAFVP